MLFQIRKEVSVRKILIQGIKPLISGIVMFATVYVTQMFLAPTWYYSILLVLEGAIIYLVLLILLKNIFLLSMISKVFRKKNS